ncbi:ComEA family DNA-binding protein [Bacillus sp. FJAT-28004]|uniref:ComEA family DNA-binding protein n=1 Tax=Bacillus sp. FJAT-28004 TaxID=1679165 RepID=UPI0006B62F0D|nr:ComEA family DNA-binding protein [Bacillus sp. FJAT-28004]
MKASAGTISGKVILFASILILTAAVLLAAAFMEPKQTETGEWVPLNEAVKTAITSLDATNAGEGVAQNKSDKQAISEKQLDAQATSVAKNTVPDETGASTAPMTSALPVTDSDIGYAGKLDINRATAAELDDLKGIGPSKAQAIIDDREKNGKYASANDLLRVKGIGEKLVQGIEDSIVARP